MMMITARIAFIYAVAGSDDDFFEFFGIHRRLIVFNICFGRSEIHFGLLYPGKFFETFRDVGRATGAVHAGYFKSGFLHICNL